MSFSCVTKETFLWLCIQPRFETGAWSNSEMTYSLHEELQSSSYVCCVQSPWAHLLEKQVFQKGMFDPKTNEIGLKLSQSSLQSRSFILLRTTGLFSLDARQFQRPKSRSLYELQLQSITQNNAPKSHVVDKAQPPDFDSWREAKIKILQAGQV